MRLDIEDIADLYGTDAARAARQGHFFGAVAVTVPGTRRRRRDPKPPPVVRGGEVREFTRLEDGSWAVRACVSSSTSWAHVKGQATRRNRQRRRVS